MDLIVLAMAKKYADSRVNGLLSGEKTAILADFALSDGGYEAEGNKIGLEVGKTYTITLDSGTYTGICKMLEADGTTLYCIGNAVDVTGIDTGEPYVVFESAAGFIGAFDFNGGTRLTISETIVTIDPKYLPGVCLPVVELSTTFAIGASFTEEENAKLKAVWESGTPMITKCNMTIKNFGNLTDCQAVWNRGLSSATCVFLLSLSGLMLQIASMDNGETWFCNIQ